MDEPGPLLVIGGVSVYRLPSGALQWRGGLAIDADGAPDAYAPAGSGLVGRDALGNAGRPGRWWGLVTDNGKPDGKPIIQAANDPCPGYFISPTALCDPHLPADDPARYVNSVRIPYLSVPPELLRIGVKKGDVAQVFYRDQSSPAIVADVGPAGKLGEGSIALALALGLDPSPRHGGTGAGVIVTLYAGSTQGWPRTLDAIGAQVALLTSAARGTDEVA